MAIKRELIQFTIVNSTDCDYNIPMFQQNVYSINATTKYSWDITIADISCGTGTIVVNSITYPLSYTATLTGLISALNALGFGFFCTETIFGSTYIYVVDDTNIYGDLDLCPSGITTTTTTTTTTAGTTTTSTTTTSTTAPTTSTTTTTTTPPPTTSTTTTSTTAPTTSTTTTSTTAPTTSTTTSTTTPPPTSTTTTTSTTTVCIGTFSLVNNSDDLDISGMLIGGASVIVTSGSFPSTPATTINGTPDTSLTIPNVYALQLTQVTSGLAGQTITVVDSLGDSQTQTIPVGTNNIIFNGVDFNCTTAVQILCSAAGVTTTTSTTSTTTAPPTTTTTTTSTTIAPTTTTTTTSTTTEAPTTTTTTTSTTTEAPTTTTTTTSTTTAPETSTTTTTSTTTSSFVTFTLAYSIIDGATACSNYPTIDTTQYYATAGSILQNGTIIYTDTALTIPAPNGFYSNGVNYWNTGAGSGNLQNQTSCGGSSTTTTTSTTTAPPTTTSTTTTTTTLLAAPLRVENTLSLDISVSDVTVNSITAAPLTGSYPIPAGENRDLTTTQFGTYSITVTFTNTITGQRITVTDSNGTSQCQTVSTSSTFTYTNCVVDGLTQVLILCEDGVC